MQVHRQQCQGCGSQEVRNIIVREENTSDSIYVRCASCGELVARYVLREYYHHGKGVESYLRSHGVSAADSGREWMEAFRRAQQEALEGYERALRELESQGKDV